MHFRHADWSLRAVVDPHENLVVRMSDHHAQDAIAQRNLVCRLGHCSVQPGATRRQTPTRLRPCWPCTVGGDHSGWSPCIGEERRRDGGDLQIRIRLW
jgi:hypothetical protein